MKLRPRDLMDPHTHFNEIEHALAKLDMAWACAALALRGGPRLTGRGNLRAQGLPKVQEHFEQLRGAYEQGDRWQAMQAVKDAIVEGLPVPQWAGKAFLKLLDEYYKGKTLNEAFGALPAGKRGAAARVEASLQGRLWGRVAHAVAEGRAASLDAALTLILKEGDFPVGKTKARELVLAQNAIQERHELGLSKLPGFSHLKPKARKQSKV